MSKKWLHWARGCRTRPLDAAISCQRRPSGRGCRTRTYAAKPVGTVAPTGTPAGPHGTRRGTSQADRAASVVWRGRAMPQGYGRSAPLMMRIGATRLVAASVQHEDTPRCGKRSQQATLAQPAAAEDVPAVRWGQPEGRGAARVPPSSVALSCVRSLPGRHSRHLDRKCCSASCPQ